MRYRPISSQVSPSPAGALLTLILACAESSAPSPRPEEPRPPEVTEIGGEVLPGRQAAAADSFVNAISIQTHLGSLGGIYDTAWTTIIRPRLLELGARHVRERMSTKAKVIDRFKDLANSGIRLTAGCWPNNGVLTSASHCVTTANAHGTGTIEAFDGWNEVDNTGGDWANKWIQWQTTMYTVYRSDPAWQEVPVLGSSLARASSTDQLGNQSTILDFGNLHSYPATGLPSAILNSWVTQWDKVAAPKPHWATETGYHNCLRCTTSGVSEGASGKYYSRLWFEFFNRGIVRTNAYELIDEGISTKDRGLNWGLLRFDGSPKPQFTATRNIIALLSDPGPAFSPDRLAYTVSDNTSTIHSTLLQKRDGRFYLALWQEVSVWNAKTKRDTSNPTRPLTITLPDSASLRVYAPLQSESAIQEVSGTSITVQVPDEVIVVEVTLEATAAP